MNEESFMEWLQFLSTDDLVQLREVAISAIDYLDKGTLANAVNDRVLDMTYWEWTDRQTE